MSSHFYLAYDLPADSPDAHIRANIPKCLFWKDFTEGVTEAFDRSICCTLFCCMDGLNNRKDSKLDHCSGTSDRNYGTICKK